MVRSASAEELLRDAREATGTPNVREAVRELTLHALRSRPLTATHIATVAITVGKGIESSDVPPTAPVRETHRGAWAGLEEAVGRALLAMELAAREFAEGRARLESDERERLIAEIAQLERALGEGWAPPGTVPAALRARIESAIALLRHAQPDGTAATGQSAPQPAGGGLSAVASGVLVGLSEGAREKQPGGR
ncbi:MAG: hypothetical protein NDI88_00035 [Lysobacter sp.]|nr:hypothetical protein [Lysobacter sp.]